MSAATEYLQLGADDRLAAIKNRLAAIRGRRVVLLLPPTGTALSRRIDLVLLQREAHRRAIQLAIVSDRPDIRAQAASLNISTFKTIEASQHGRWKQGRGKIFLPRYHKPSPEPPLEELQTSTRRTSRPQSPARTLIERLLVLAVLTAVIGLTAYIALPSAVVTVALRPSEITTTVEITADASAESLDIASALIPAQIIRATVETTLTVPTSGEQNLEALPATGTATFTNQTARRVSIPASTILSTSADAPVLFQTTSTVSVPAGSGQRADIAIRALPSSAGGIGNVDAGMINAIIGPLASRVSVINLAPTAGGETRAVKIVAESDAAHLLNSVRAQLQSLAYEKMQARLTASQLIIIETIQIESERKDWTSYSATVGAVSDELSLSMRAVVSAMAVDDHFGRQIVAARLTAAVPADQQLQKETIAYLRGPLIQQTSPSQVVFSAGGSAKVLPQLDTGQLQESLAGSSLAAAKSTLRAHPQITVSDPPQIALSPPSLQQMPLLPIRIQIQVPATQETR